MRITFVGGVFLMILLLRGSIAPQLLTIIFCFHGRSFGRLRSPPLPPRSLSSRGLLLGRRLLLLIIYGNVALYYKIGVVCANGMGRAYTICFFTVQWLWICGLWCLVFLGCSGLCPARCWISFLAGWGLWGGMIMFWFGR